MQKYLGVDLSSELGWSHPINSITTKASLLPRNLKPSLRMPDQRPAIQQISTG